MSVKPKSMFPEGVELGTVSKEVANETIQEWEKQNQLRQQEASRRLFEAAKELGVSPIPKTDYSMPEFDLATGQMKTARQKFADDLSQNMSGDNYTNYLQTEIQKKLKEDEAYHQEIINFDAVAAEDEIANLQTELDISSKYAEEIINLKNQIEADELTFSSLPQNDAYRVELKNRINKNKAKYYELNKKYGGETVQTLRKSIAEKKIALTQKKRLQELLKSNDTAVNDPNYNKYVKTGKETPWDEVGNSKVIVAGRTAAKRTYDDLSSAAWALYKRNNPDAKISNSSYMPEANIFEQMRDEEFDLLAYYIGKDKETGGNQAETYVELMKETLQNRKGQEIYEQYLKDNTVLEVLYGVPAGLDQFANGVTSLFNFKDDYIPASPVQVAGSLAREDLGDAGFSMPEWLGGASLGQMAYDSVQTTANMAPSIAASYLIGLINPVAGTVTGAALMGGSAAGNAYQEALNNGWGKAEARTYSTLIGASEALLSATISKVFGGKLVSEAVENAIKGVTNGAARFALNYGAAFFGEGLEEAAQEILSPLFENIAFGYNRKGFDDIDWAEVAYSFLLGGLSGGMFETVGSGVKQISSVASVMKEYNTPEKTQNLLKLALSFPTESNANKLATKYNTQVKTNGKLSANKVYNLVVATENVVTERLTKLGETQNVPAIASAVVKAVTTGQLTAKEKNVLSSSRHGVELLNEINVTEEAETPVLQSSANVENVLAGGTNGTNIGTSDNVSGINDTFSGTVAAEVDTDISNIAENKNTADNSGKKRFSLIGYSKKQIENWKNSKSIIIYENEEQLRQFIRDAVKGMNLDKKIYFGFVSEELALRIKQETGIDVNKYNCTLRASEVRKILKDHGNEDTESLRGQRAITEDDFVMIPQIIQEPDQIILSDELFEGKPVINFVKTINGKTTIAAYVSAKHLDLTVQTMYSGKNKGNLSIAAGEQAPANTPEANAGTVSNDIIDEKTSDVNSSISDNGENYSDSPENDSSDSGELHQDGDMVTFGGIDTEKGKHLDKAQQDEIKDIGEKIGQEVVFEDFYKLEKFKGKKKVADGFLGADGKVHINYYAKRPVQFLLKHEITHYLKRKLSDFAYQDFMGFVLKSKAFTNWMHSKGFASMTDLKKDVYDRYSEVKNFNEEKCYDEILADFVGDYLFGGENAISQKLIDALGPKQKKTFMETIKDILAHIKQKFSEKARLQQEIIDIEERFLQLYNEAVAAPVKENADSGEVYSISIDSEGQFVKVDTRQELFDGKSVSEMQNIARNIIKENFKGKVLKVGKDGRAFVNKRSSEEYSYPANRRMNDELKKTKMRASPELDNLLVVSNYLDHQTDDGRHPEATGGWDIYATRFEVAGVMFEGEVKIMITDRGYVFYDITQIKRTTRNGGQTEINSAAASGSPSINSIADKSNTVKNNISEEGEDYSIPATSTPEELLEAYENGEISRQEYLDALKKEKTLNLKEIADLTEEDANTTPKLKKKTGVSDGDKVSKFYDSVLESDIFDLNFKAEVATDTFVEKYTSVTNKETLKKAAKELDEGGRSYVSKWWATDPAHASLIDTAVGFILMDRYQRIGDYDSAAAVTEKVREFGTAGGQQVQIFSILGRLSPETMAIYAQRELDKAYKIFVKDKSQKWIDKNAEKFKLTEDDIEFIRRNTMQAAMFEENTRPKAIFLAEIAARLQDKIPPQKGDSIRAFQRNAMLLNLKTNIRNVAGNAGMVGVFIASDVFGSGIDKMVAKKTGVRTKGNFNFKSVAGLKKGLYESYDDFKRGIRTKQEELDRFDVNINHGGKSFNDNGEGVFGTGILKDQLNAVAKALNKIDNFTSFCLEAGDRPFFEMWYMNSLNTQMKLNNVDIPTAEMMEVARQEALQRTWQDDNTFTSSVSQLKRVMNKAHLPNSNYGLGDFVLKFVKTPSNLAKAIIEFSPVGFYGATSNAIKLKNAIETDRFTPQLQKEFVRSLSNAITGTLLYTLVAVGAALGLVKLSGDGDDDKDASNFEKYIMGIPPYSIEFFGVPIAYDWMQPFGSILATVAEFMENRETNPEMDAADAVWEAICAGGKTFTQQSFLQSMYEFFSGDDAIDGLANIFLAEPAAFVPQALSQVASFTDRYRRTSYDANSDFQTAINKVMAKIPGLRTKLPKQVNALGEDVKNPQYFKETFGVWEAFASPWNTYPKSSKEVVGEIYKLYKDSGNDSVMPRVAPNYIEVKGNRITFASEEKADFQRAMGDRSVQMLAQLFDSKEYSNLTDTQKVEVVGKIYSYAYARAKSELEYNFETLSAMEGNNKNGQPILTKEKYEKLPEKARKQLAEEYFLSTAEVKYMDDYKKLVEHYIRQAKE